MASPAAVLSILVEANTSAANANLAKTNAELDATKASAVATTSATSKTGSAMRKLGTAAKWGGAALAVGFVVEAKKAVTSTQDLTKTTLTLHKNLGLGVKLSSEWGAALKARGADSQKAGMAFKTFATQLSSAGHGSATAIKMFRELGFSQADIQKSMTNTEFALAKVSDGLNHLPAGADKATFAGKLFGRGWQTVAPILRDGSAAMQETLDTQEKYGAFLEGKGFAQQKTLLQNIKDNKSAWLGLQVQLAGFVTPALNAVSDQFQRIAKIMANPKLTQDEKFTKVANILEKDMSKALNVIVDMIPTIASRVGDQAPKIAKGLVEGFLKADVWGKLLIGTWLISKFGGWSAIGSLGSKIGSRIGGRMSTTVAEKAVLTEGSSIPALMVARQGRWAALGATLGTFIGPAIAVAMMPYLSDALDNWLVKHGVNVPGLHGGPEAAAVGRTGDILNVANKAFGGGQVNDAPVTDLGKSLDRLRGKYGDLTTAAQHMSVKSRQALIELAATMVTQNKLSRFSLVDLVDEFGLTRTKTLDALDKVKGGFKGAGNVIQHVANQSSDQWAAKQQKVRDDANKTTQKVSASADKMAGNVGNSYANMVNATGKGMDTLRDNTNAALKALGLDNAVQFRTNEAPVGAGGQGHRAGAQRGAVIPGTGDGDKVHVMAEPGEGFINKTAVKALGGPKAINAINAAIPRFAMGGSVGGDTAGLVAPFLGALHSMSGATHTPINVLSGFRSRAEQAALYARYLAGTGNLAAAPGTSHHELGIAADISPGRETFGGVAGKFGMGFTVPSESWHIELLNAAAGKLGAGPQKLARIILQGPAGPLRNMGQGSLDKTRNAANAFIRKQWASAGQLNFTGGKFDLNQLAQLWIGARGSRGIAPLMAHVAMAESGGDPMAHNPSGATGLWQILGALVPGNLYDPHINALNAVAKYKTQGLGAWAASQSVWGRYAQKGGMVMPPFAGSFGQGGVVPGPMGSPRTIIAHGGEPVGTPNITVNVEHSYAPGMEWLADFVDSRVDIGLDEDRAHGRNVKAFDG